MNSGLNRFIKAQENQYEIALTEIKNGKKNITLDVVHISANIRIRE